MNIKQKLRNNEEIYYWYRRLLIFKNRILCIINKEKFVKKTFKKIMGYELNLNNPVTFNEKIQWIKQNRMTKEYITCADKFAIREYVSKKHPQYKDNFANLLKVYLNPNEIKLKDLPQKFVIKCNHGCGFNFVCTNKDLINEKMLIKQVKKWYNTAYEYLVGEFQYHNMKKVIYAEDFINTPNGELPSDYKFYCTKGKILLVMICLDRKGDHASEYHYLDMNWNPLLIDKKTNIEKTKQLAKPIHFEQMCEMAKQLSSEFDFVRIDFFDGLNKAILGEMTFTPGGGMDIDYDYQTDIELGKLIDLGNTRNGDI